MKKAMISLIIGTLVTTSSIGVLAAPGGHSKPGPWPQKPGYEEKHGPYHKNDQQDWKLKSDAGYVLERTAKTMREAQMVSRRGRRYSGLALAIAHQQRAQELYANGSYREAIFFSLRARDLAFQIISNNHGRPQPGFGRDDREGCYNDGPSGAELDARLDRHKMGRDKDAVHLNIEFHL